jgi:hypothetical protein
MKPEDLITYGLIIVAVGFGLRLISWSAITIIDYLNNPIVVIAGDAVVTKTTVVFNSADFNSVMLKPFLHQVDYIGEGLLYVGIATILFILILTVSDKTKLDFSGQLTEEPELLLNGIPITRLENVRSNLAWPLSRVLLNRVDDSIYIATHGRGNAESKYAEALRYMKGYFPKELMQDGTDSWVTVYLKICLRFIAHNQPDNNPVEMVGLDAKRFVSNTIAEYISKRDPILIRDLAIHAGSSLTEFVVWLTSSGAGTPL